MTPKTANEALGMGPEARSMRWMSMAIAEGPDAVEVVSKSRNLVVVIGDAIG